MCTHRGRQVVVLWLGTILSMDKDTKFQFFLARLFGHLVTAIDDGTIVTGYLWRGCMYVVAVDQMP